MKIVRLTRHTATPEQVAELRRIFGESVEVIEHSETVPNAARVAEIVREYNADVLEAVLPLSMMAEVTNPRSGVGVPVVRAITNRVLDESGNVTFVFSHYERVIRVEVVTERLTDRFFFGAKENALSKVLPQPNILNIQNIWLGLRMVH